MITMSKARVLFLDPNSKALIGLAVLASRLKQRDIPCKVFRPRAYSPARLVTRLSNGEADELRDFAPTVIARSVSCGNIDEVSRTNMILRDMYRDAWFAIGGPAPTLDIQNAMGVTYADFAVAGDGAEVFPTLLEIIGGAKRGDTLSGGQIDAIAELPGVRFRTDEASDTFVGKETVVSRAQRVLRPNYDLDVLAEMIQEVEKDGEGVGRLDLVFDRGCVYSCSFCTPTLTSKVVQIPEKEIMDFLSDIQGAMASGRWPYKQIKIRLYDNDFLQNVGRNRKLHPLLEKADFIGPGQPLSVYSIKASLASFDRDPDFSVKLMQQLGVEEAWMGIDGLTSGMFERLGKSGKFERINPTIERIVAAGIRPVMWLILSDQDSTLEELVVTALRVKDLCNTHRSLWFEMNAGLSPDYGTPAYSQTRAREEITQWLRKGDYEYPLMKAQIPADPAAAKFIEVFAERLAFNEGPQRSWGAGPSYYYRDVYLHSLLDAVGETTGQVISSWT
ncbi:MAG: hypothetical protein HQ596_07770 [Candidatus Saganbacteria bacterium]|nr:hypothetical protein [Candidatus Saganbacteria bacterium]